MPEISDTFTMDDDEVIPDSEDELPPKIPTAGAFGIPPPMPVIPNHAVPTSLSHSSISQFSSVAPPYDPSSVNISNFTTTTNSSSSSAPSDPSFFTSFAPTASMFTAPGQPVVVPRRPVPLRLWKEPHPVVPHGTVVIPTEPISPFTDTSFAASASHHPVVNSIMLPSEVSIEPNPQSESGDADNLNIRHPRVPTSVPSTLNSDIINITSSEDEADPKRVKPRRKPSISRKRKSLLASDDESDYIDKETAPLPGPKPKRKSQPKTRKSSPTLLDPVSLDLNEDVGRQELAKPKRKRKSQAKSRPSAAKGTSPHDEERDAETSRASPDPLDIIETVVDPPKKRRKTTVGSRKVEVVIYKSKEFIDDDVDDNNVDQPNHASSSAISYMIPKSTPSEHSSQAPTLIQSPTVGTRPIGQKRRRVVATFSDDEDEPPNHSDLVLSAPSTWGRDNILPSEVEDAESSHVPVSLPSGNANEMDVFSDTGKPKVKGKGKKKGSEKPKKSTKGGKEPGTKGKAKKKATEAASGSEHLDDDVGGATDGAAQPSTSKHHDIPDMRVVGEDEVPSKHVASAPATPSPKKIPAPAPRQSIPKAKVEIDPYSLAVTKENLTISDILRKTGMAKGSGSVLRVGLSRGAKIAPLHARLKTPPPRPPPLPKAKPRKDEDEIDSEEEYEGLSAAAIARKREEKRRAAWFSP